MSILKMRWSANQGSIFTEDKVKEKHGFIFIEKHDSVAFNVGEELARHIVDLHNLSLQK